MQKDKLQHRQLKRWTAQIIVDVGKCRPLWNFNNM
jgi:hypothetical protein